MTKVIAELGLSHNGNWRTADDLSDQALEAGSDYVKWQLITDLERLALQRGANYEEYKQRIPLLTYGHWQAIYCTIPRHKRMATVFTPRDVHRAMEMEIDNLKIGHAELKNQGLLFLASHYAHKMFVTYPYSSREWSLGICGFGAGEMYCIPNYPADVDVAVSSLDDFIHAKLGYSDHVKSTAAAVKAITQGRPYVEVHVHANDCPGCPDHCVSKSMEELKHLCDLAHKEEK